MEKNNEKSYSHLDGMNPAILKNLKIYSITASVLAAIAMVAGCNGCGKSCEAGVSNPPLQGNTEEVKVANPDKKTPQKPAFPLPNEKPIQHVELQDGNITVIVPSGYQTLADIQAKDLGNCIKIVPQFLHMQPMYNGIVAETYVSNDGTNLGYYAGNGTMFYKRSEDNIQIDLQQALHSPTQGFYAQSGLNYCANSHEFTHYVVDGRPLPSWANEGLAEYTQSFTQAGSKDYLTCTESGWYGQDFWGDNQKKNFGFSDLSAPYSNDVNAGPQFGPKWYRTGFCFWQGIEKNFSISERDNVLTALGKLKQSDYVGQDYTSVFINEVLMKNIADTDKLKEYLAKFGFQEGKNY